MVAAQAIVEQPKLVFQLSSGDLNPLHMDRVVTLTGLYKRKRFRDKETRQPLPQRAGGAHGVPPGRIRPTYDRYSIPKIQSVARKASETLGAHPAALGRGALHRGDRSRQEGLRRGRPRHQRGGGEHRAVPPVHLREQLRLPRRQHPRAARPHAAPTIRRCLRVGPGDVDLYDYWMNIHFPGLRTLGAARAGRDLRAAAEAGLQLPRPAGAVRHDDEAARDAPGDAHRARRARGDLQLRRSAGAGDAGGRVPGRARRRRRTSA